MTLTALDDFAGTGWGVACQWLDIEEQGVELMDEAVASRDAAGMTTVARDVWTHLADTADAPLEHDLYIASPPCQTFSAAGKGAGRQALDTVLQLIEQRAYLNVDQLHAFGAGHDPRTALVLAPLVRIYRNLPERIVLEQVPPVLPVWERYAEELRRWGYSVTTGIVNAEQYGVPQTRRRAILIARWDGEARLPTPTHSRYYSRDPKRLDGGVKPWVSMAKALGWDGDGYLRSNYGTGGDPAARGERLLSHPAATVTSKVDRAKWVFRNGNQANAARRLVDLPAPTVMFGARSNKVEWMPVDRAEDPAASGVRVSTTEAAVLQSYPAGFHFAGAKGKQFLQIGNAVPPLLGRAILAEVMS